MAKYKLNTKGEIVKTDFEERYNKEDYTAHLAGAEKRLKEMEAQDGVYVAKYENVARNHPFVLEESEERRNAIWLYHENFVASKLIGQQIKGLKKAIKNTKNEMKEIEKQTGIKFE